MSMPRQYQSYGRRGPPLHGPTHRGNPMPSHNQVHRVASQPTEQPVPSTPVEETMPSPYSNHEQVVRFIRDGWIKVKKDYNDPPEDPERRVEYYTEAEPNPALKDFVPFNLEEFSKRRKASSS